MPVLAACYLTHELHILHCDCCDIGAGAVMFYRLRTYAIDAVAATPAASTTGSASSRGFVLHRVIGSAQSPDSTGQAAFVSDVPQAGPASSASRVQGLLISARPDVAAKLWQSPDVTAVIPDTLVELQSKLITCID